MPGGLPKCGGWGMKPAMNTPTAAGSKQQAIQEALALHREGKHELAMQRYVAILQQDPGNLDALARGQLAALVLRIDARLPAAEARIGAPQFELFQDILHRVANSPARPDNIVIGA